MAITSYWLVKRKGWLIGLVFVLTLVAIPFAYLGIRSARLRSEYEEQLRLAWAEGLPTNVKQFASLVPVPKDSENAGPLYRAMSAVTRKGTDLLPEYSRAITFEPNDKAVALSGAALGSEEEVLKLADRAVVLPHCWFNRDWSKGELLLDQEAFSAKQAAFALLLRGSLAAHNGRVSDALGDARKAMVVSAHLREDPLMTSQMTSRAVEASVLRQLACWSFRYRTEPAYLKEYGKVFRARRKPDFKLEHHMYLLSILSIIDYVSTEKGRKDLQVEPRGVDTVVRTLLPPDVGRVRIVQGARKVWAALDKPVAIMGSALDSGNMEAMGGLVSFPMAARAYSTLGADEDTTMNELKYFDAQTVLGEALLRALSEPMIPRAIKTKDLISPYKFKPIIYQFDGKQITVSASEPMTVRIPPNMPKNSPFK